MDQNVETWTVRVDADTSGLSEELANATTSGRQFSRALSTAFQSVAIQGRSVTDTLRTLGLSLSQMTLQAAFKPLEQASGSILQSLVSGGLGIGGSVAAGGIPVPFAAGGVISSPIAFPLSAGGTGIAGERGAEAIMPLARGPDGRLGVKADGTSGGIVVNFNVSTPDAESFRRTESQLATMLGRVVARGQRNA